MSRFTNKQKEKIAHHIKNEARSLFSTYGYNKTSIQDITNAVGIAQGTFYHFYPSKAVLYFLILEQEEKSIHNDLTEQQIQPEEQPKQYFIRMLQQAITSLEQNPLVRELLIGHHLTRIIASLPEEIVANHITKDDESFISLIHHWQENGLTFTKEPPIVAASLRSLFLLTTHRKEIGKQHYDKTIELFIHALADALIEERSS